MKTLNKKELENVQGGKAYRVNSLPPESSYDSLNKSDIYETPKEILSYIENRGWIVRSKVIIPEFEERFL